MLNRVISPKTLSIWLLNCVFITSCGTGGPAPVSNRTGHEHHSKRPTIPKQQEHKSTKHDKKILSQHIVAKGDTLHSIAWNYDLDYKEIADWNNIKEPYLIYPRQIIRLVAPDNKVTSGIKPVLSKKKTKRIKADIASTKINWQWPTLGELIESNSLVSKKGLDISGKRGQAVRNAAPGTVVYSGSGLLGYGKLIIIKHNETYLSAYAHNEVILVQEGDIIPNHQQIARMGQDNNGGALLHFEIRKNGKPVNPLNYLPKKNF